ncbi:hypothetical protein [Streptomyces xanthii]|uniref:Lipoprotein n=1 Tax=Streptomyces xanthii TaxID=2768069 RepID=A0A7H1BFI5_9ACTN|nr:hypothetical protein [Streptomyces xanthii]QNS07490.1 hypothetical protein IAG42_30405 [Streptomyces xanthii]
MPRKITPASLLLTAAAAVSAAASSGCMSVSTPDVPDRPASPSVTAPQPRPDGRAERPITQTPAGDGMRRTGASPHPSKPHSAPSPPPARHAAPPPEQPAPRVPAPRAEAEPPPAPKPPAQTDVCALGRRYGGWGPDSPQSAICRDVYGG